MNFYCQFVFYFKFYILFPLCIAFFHFMIVFFFYVSLPLLEISSYRKREMKKEDVAKN